MRLAVAIRDPTGPTGITGNTEDGETRCVMMPRSPARSPCCCHGDKSWGWREKGGGAAGQSVLGGGGGLHFSLATPLESLGCPLTSTKP